jgi:hypothetical protein
MVGRAIRRGGLPSRFGRPIGEKRLGRSFALPVELSTIAII